MIPPTEVCTFSIDTLQLTVARGKKIAIQFFHVTLEPKNSNAVILTAETEKGCSLLPHPTLDSSV
jgi:hypothetical protein